MTSTSVDPGLSQSVSGAGPVSLARHPAPLPGVALSVTVLATLGHELAGWADARAIAVAALGVYVVAILRGLSRRGWVLLAVIAVLAAGLRATSRIDGAVLFLGAYKACYLATLFTALGFLREAAETSRAIHRAGHFFITQPPGRRYLALTLGGHLFGLILNFGSLTLLGTMIRRTNTLAAARGDTAVQALRERRMMLALLRGFATVTVWSPLTVSLAVVLSSLPQANPRHVIPLMMVTATLFLGLGWLVDRLVDHPRGAPRAGAAGTADSGAGWGVVLPLLGLFVLVMAASTLLAWAAQVALIVAVMVSVPAIGMGWLFVQYRRAGKWRAVRLAVRRLRRHAVGVFPTYATEIVLLGSAGFAGTLVAKASSAAEVARMIEAIHPAPVGLAIALIFVVVIVGQIGFNPIVAVTILAGAIPDPRLFGLSPVVLAVAFTGAWGLTAGSSPFTASTLTIGRLTGRSPGWVGRHWNGLYTLLGLAVLCAWILGLDLMAG